MLQKTNITIASLGLMNVLAWTQPSMAGVLHEAHLNGYIEDLSPFGGGYTSVIFNTVNSSGYDEFWAEGGSSVTTYANPLWAELDVQVGNGVFDVGLDFSYTLEFDQPTWVYVDSNFAGMHGFVTVDDGAYLVEAQQPWTIEGTVHELPGFPGEMSLDLDFVAVQGACCLVDSCDMMGQADCEAADGMWMAGEECLETNCNVAWGACCTNGICVMEFLDAGDCLVYGGTWLGPGSNCDQCEESGSECPGDTDNNGVVNIEDLLNMLGSWGACP